MHHSVLNMAYLLSGNYGFLISFDVMDDGIFYL